MSGTAEAGTKVILTDGSGNPIGQTTADGSGNWAFTRPLRSTRLLLQNLAEPMSHVLFYESGPRSRRRDGWHRLRRCSRARPLPHGLCWPLGR
ncbi:hypothetical protein V0R58_26475 [Pseudomonas inefficax]|nr:hypothetical protein [Pseudomonas inefficax]